MAPCGRVNGQSAIKQTPYQSWQRKKLSELRSVNGKQIFRECMMMQRNGKKLSQLMLLSCLILLTGCATKSNPCPQVSKAEIPPLPTSAEAPPQIKSCIPSCSKALSLELNNMLDTLTETEKPL